VLFDRNALYHLVMSLKLSDWADISQIVSGFAVVVTLVFLIFEIRDNTSVTRAAVWERSADRLIELRYHTLDNPEVARLFQAWLDGDDEGFTRTDSIRQVQLVGNIFQALEQAYFAKQYGLLGPAEWRRFERQICLSYARAGSSETVSAALPVVMTEEFMAFMAETCRE
jgi:hypothetical protein